MANVIPEAKVAEARLAFLKKYEIEQDKYAKNKDIQLYVYICIKFWTPTALRSKLSPFLKIDILLRYGFN